MHGAADYISGVHVWFPLNHFAYANTKAFCHERQPSSAATSTAAPSSRRAARNLWQNGLNAANEASPPLVPPPASCSRATRSARAYKSSAMNSAAEASTTARRRRAATARRGSTSPSPTASARVWASSAARRRSTTARRRAAATINAPCTSSAEPAARARRHRHGRAVLGRRHRQVHVGDAQELGRHGRCRRRRRRSRSRACLEQTRWERRWDATLSLTQSAATSWHFDFCKQLFPSIAVVRVHVVAASGGRRPPAGWLPSDGRDGCAGHRHGHGGRRQLRAERRIRVSSLLHTRIPPTPPRRAPSTRPSRRRPPAADHRHRDGRRGAAPAAPLARALEELELDARRAVGAVGGGRGRRLVGLALAGFGSDDFSAARWRAYATAASTAVEHAAELRPI